MDKYIPIFIIQLLSVTLCFGQGGSAFGPKGGLTLATQNYSGYDRDVLVTGHAAFYIESLSEEDRNALFAQLGYHVRGSTIRTPRYTNNNGDIVKARNQDSKFGNLALYVGGKQKFDLGYNKKWYYDFALRGEYTLDVSLPTIYEHLEDEINRFVFGVTAGIGMEMMFSELVGGLIEINVNPDVTSQVVIPAQASVTNPNQIIPEKRIHNVSFELTFGMRFLRKVTYID